MWTLLRIALVVAACAALTCAAAALPDTPSPPWSPNYPGYCLDSPAMIEPCENSGYYLEPGVGCSNDGFGGCPGSLNRFDTLEECEETCIGLSLPVCEQPIITGNLTAGLGAPLTEQWGLDFLSGQCRRFVKVAFGGNGNRFATEADCIEACGAPIKPAPVCELPLDKGFCQNRSTPWGFIGSCRQFGYSGCGGNGNRFDSLDDCEFACGNNVVFTSPV